MTRYQYRFAPVLAGIFASGLMPVVAAAAAPACPQGMTVSQDGKTCATDSASAANPAGSFDALGNIMDKTKQEINAKQAVATSKEDMFGSEQYKKMQEGHWQYFQANSSAKRGEYCTAMFIKQNMSVAILGPGGQYQGALMMFTALTSNDTFPQSEQPRVIQVNLKQGNDPAATVGVFNFNLGKWQTPVVTFAVPTIEAALQGMEDTLDFHLQYEGKDIGSIEWHSGIAARDELKKCIAGK
ncbi:MAG: hypothetical protein SXG53_10595 [Pseudomonadota bacterium]|nr:hypothetical protein [Pseudomonadota bacterium]